MNTVAIIQARMRSVRFPGKVMQNICGTPMIGLILERLSKTTSINQIVVATSKDPQNDSMVKHINERGYLVYRGSEDDVLDRYYQAAKEVDAHTIVRITGDCPLIDPVLVDEIIAKFLEAGVDVFLVKLH